MVCPSTQESESVQQFLFSHPDILPEEVLVHVCSENEEIWGIWEIEQRRFGEMANGRPFGGPPTVQIE